MKRKFLLIFVFVLILAIAIGFLVFKYVFREADTSVGSAKAVAQLSSDQLLTAYESDETNANNLYLDKVIEVTGRVDMVSEDSLGYSVYLKAPADISGVICSFSKPEPDIQDITTGDTIVIKGICTGYLLDVVMNKCALAE